MKFNKDEIQILIVALRDYEEKGILAMKKSIGFNKSIGRKQAFDANCLLSRIIRENEKSKD